MLRCGFIRESVERKILQVVILIRKRCFGNIVPRKPPQKTNINHLCIDFPINFNSLLSADVFGRACRRCQSLYCSKTKLICWTLMLNDLEHSKLKAFWSQFEIWMVELKRFLHVFEIKFQNFNDFWSIEKFCVVDYQLFLKIWKLTFFESNFSSIYRLLLIMMNLKF